MVAQWLWMQQEVAALLVQALVAELAVVEE